MLSAPLPFTMHRPNVFFAENIAYDKENNELGTALNSAMEKWNEGRFPIEPGEHQDLPVFDTLEVMTDNGHGMMVPVDIHISLHVERQLYFGQYPIQQISGFKDEISGGIITNAFTVGILSPEEVERDWQRVDNEDDAPIPPVLALTGLVGWVQE